MELFASHVAQLEIVCACILLQDEACQQLMAMAISQTENRGNPEAIEKCLSEWLEQYGSYEEAVLQLSTQVSLDLEIVKFCDAHGIEISTTEARQGHLSYKEVSDFFNKHGLAHPQLQFVGDSVDEAVAKYCSEHGIQVPLNRTSSSISREVLAAFMDKHGLEGGSRILNGCM
jgi:hypothetical protein